MQKKTKDKEYSERELVEGCVRNERFFQERLYRRFFPAMMRMCIRHTRDEDLSVELVNGGMLRVFQKLHTFEFKGSLEGWIRRIIYRYLVDYYRKEARGFHFLDLEQRDAPLKAQALDGLYLEDLLKLVEALPHCTREVFRLFAIEGYSHLEIAAQLDISPGTSKWHLSEARKRLRILIRKHYKNQYYAG